MEVIEINVCGVYMTKTRALKAALRDAIRTLARSRGYRFFATVTLGCVDGVEHVYPDPSKLKGWDYVTFFHDCYPEGKTEESPDIPLVELYARIEPPLR